jgi:hypothetical protein
VAAVGWCPYPTERRHRFTYALHGGKTFREPACERLSSLLEPKSTGCYVVGLHGLMALATANSDDERSRRMRSGRTGTRAISGKRVALPEFPKADHLLYGVGCQNGRQRRPLWFSMNFVPMAVT